MTLIETTYDGAEQPIDDITVKIFLFLIHMLIFILSNQWLRGTLLFLTHKRAYTIQDTEFTFI